MKFKRNIITPYVTLIFLVVGLSGILMFFHLFDNYTKALHEISGLMFVVFSIFHIIINWTSLKSHFKQKIFIGAAMVVFVLSVGLILAGMLHGKHEQGSNKSARSVKSSKSCSHAVVQSIEE